MYSRPGGAFIHMLSLRDPFTWCLDLPGGGTLDGQAAWSLAVLGAPAVLALRDRSAAQLSVLHPAIRLCGDATGAAAPGYPPHFILEYTAGVCWRVHYVGPSTD